VNPSRAASANPNSSPEWNSALASVGEVIDQTTPGDVAINVTAAM
jgi:hypothetical protein